MSKPSLDWSRVQAFLAVAETGSLSAAARALGQSQPTVGRHVQALEEGMGVALFRRQAKGMELTEVGARLRPAAEAMRDAAHRLALTAAGEADDTGGTVRITASVFVSHHLLPPILADLRAQAPEIQIELVASDASDNLLFREADIAIRMYRPAQLDMVARRLGDMALGLFAAKSYLARRGRPARAEELFAHDIIGYDTSELILEGMRAQGYQAARDWFVVRCDHQTTYWELVRAGCGIGFCQVPTGRLDPAVEQLQLGLKIPPLEVWLTTHERLRHTPRVRRVWQHLATALPPLLS